MVGFTYLHQQIIIKLLGFGTSLNSIVATSAEYSVHLSIFQLSEGAYRPFQIFQLATIRNLLAVAQTSLGFHPTTCSTSSSQSPFPSASTPLGNHPGFGQQLRQALPHGEKTQIQRNRHPGMLLHSTFGQQPR